MRLQPVRMPNALNRTGADTKHPKVSAWLDRHERFVFHFTPTSCSWLNAVEATLPSCPSNV